MDKGVKEEKEATEETEEKEDREEKGAKEAKEEIVEAVVDEITMVRTVTNKEGSVEEGIEITGKVDSKKRKFTSIKLQGNHLQTS